jgi:hypothetical protein
MIGLSFQTQSITNEKFSIEAGRPSIAQASQSTANQLVLAVGAFDPIDESLNFNKSNLPYTESPKYSIVQFKEGKADSNWLKKNGITVVSYIPNNAFVVVSNDKNNKILAKNKSIRWQGKFLSTYKISPSLWSSNLKRQNKYNLVVSLFSDIPQKSIPLILRKYLPNIEVKQLFPDIKTNEIILSCNHANIEETINKLAQIDAVHFVQLLKQERFHNTEAVSAVQGNADSGGSAGDDNYTPNNTPIFDKGLVGSGQIVGVADSGLDTNEDWFVHYDNGQTVTHIVTEAEPTNPPQIGTLFPNQKVIGYFVMPDADAYDHRGADFHGTHVTGSIAGDRLDSVFSGPSGSISSPNNSGYDNDDGMAPNAQILFQDLGGEPSGDLSGQGSSPMWEQAYNAGARIHSNSYGSDSKGEYSFGDIRVDRTLRQFEDMLILFSAGNSSGNAQPNSVGSPAVAKNVVTVGALAHGNNNNKATFSNIGPTDDGRLKPDIMAPGLTIESAGGNEINNTNIHFPARKTLSGTSMSTPITAGSSALLRQYFTDGFYPTGAANPADAHNPTGPLMKAMLINGAGIDGGHFNNDIGWGRVNLSNSLMFDDSDKKLRVWEVTNAGGLKTNEDIQFKVSVLSDKSLTITLVWYDLPGPFGSSKTLINDLDLEVEINGQVYKGNVFSGAAESTTGGVRDSINTVEQVRISTPVEGIYTITVKGNNIPGDETVNSFRQGFGLAATGNFNSVLSTAVELTPITNLSATMLGENGIQLSWSGDNADYFEIYRVEGSCATADFKNLRVVGMSETPSYTDFRSLNGQQYAYKIRPGQYRGLGDLSSVCVEITSNQACDLIPSFSQSSIVVSNNIGDLCHNNLQWNTATSNCPNSPNIKYNIYRSEDSDFIPSPDNLLTTITSTSYDDIRAPDVPAFYIVRAEDNSPNGSGPNGGTETTGTSKVRSLAVGTGFTSGPVFEDVDTVSIMNLSFPWQVVSDRAADGILSYKTGEANQSYPNDTCSSIVTNEIALTADVANPKLEYKAFYDLERNWDGVVVEISTDDGQTWTDLPPDGGYPGNFSETTANPVNACGYPSTHGAFSGSNNAFDTFTHDLNAFSGQNVKVRWRLSTDPASEFAGFYIDSIKYPNIQTPNACTVNTAPARPKPGFYFDRAKNGHGFVIEPIANTDLYFTIFYTYKEDGTPEWYTSQPTLENNVLNINSLTDPAAGALNRFIYDFNVDPTGAGNPNTLDDTVGESFLKVDFNEAVATAANACNDGFIRGGNQALATWKIGNETGQWCVEPLANVIGNPLDPDFGGTWWAGIDDDGWGFSLAFTGDTIVVIIYYFDANGSPRWALGTQAGYLLGQEITLDMLEFAGFARDAAAIELETVSTGALTLTINSRTGTGNDGNINLDINYQGSEGGNWNRTNVPITIFTEAH